MLYQQITGLYNVSDWGFQLIYMKEKNHYEILQVNESAKLETIHAAYKRVAKEYQYIDADLQDYITEMQKLNKAYVVLCDPEKRAKYDEISDESYSFSVTYKDENLTEDSEQEIAVEIDEESEAKYEFKVKTCNAYLENGGRIAVIGEVFPISGKASEGWIHLTFNAYNNNGRLIGTSDAIFEKSRKYLTFNQGFYVKPESEIPAKLIAYFEEY